MKEHVSGCCLDAGKAHWGTERKPRSVTNRQCELQEGT